jgi:hypothetical protein
MMERMCPFFLFFILSAHFDAQFVADLFRAFVLMHGGDIPRQKQGGDVLIMLIREYQPHKVNWNIYLVNLLGISAIKQLTVQMNVHSNETRFHLSLKSAIYLFLRMALFLG